MAENVVMKTKAASESDEPLGQFTWRRVIVRQSTVWRPPTDVYELDDRLVILVEIAGMREGDFRIALQDRHLIISGVRKQLVEGANLACHQMEVQRGEFRTDVYLPWPVRREEVTAVYRDGLLRIELPQARRQYIAVVNVDIVEE